MSKTENESESDKELDTPASSANKPIGAEYADYIEGCSTAGITPLSFSDWMHESLAEDKQITQQEAMDTMVLGRPRTGYEHHMATVMQKHNITVGSSFYDRTDLRQDIDDPGSIGLALEKQRLERMHIILSESAKYIEQAGQAADTGAKIAHQAADRVLEQHEDNSAKLIAAYRKETKALRGHVDRQVELLTQQTENLHERLKLQQQEIDELAKAKNPRSVFGKWIGRQ